MLEEFDKEGFLLRKRYNSCRDECKSIFFLRFGTQCFDFSLQRARLSRASILIKVKGPVNICLSAKRSVSSKIWGVSKVRVHFQTNWNWKRENEKNFSSKKRKSRNFRNVLFQWIETIKMIEFLQVVCLTSRFRFHCDEGFSFFRFTLNDFEKSKDDVSVVRTNQGESQWNKFIEERKRTVNYSTMRPKDKMIDFIIEMTLIFTPFVCSMSFESKNKVKLTVNSTKKQIWQSWLL